MNNGKAPEQPRMRELLKAVDKSVGALAAETKTLDTTVEQYGIRQPPGTDATVAGAYRNIQAVGLKLAKHLEQQGDLAVEQAKAVKTNMEAEVEEFRRMLMREADEGIERAEEYKNRCYSVAETVRMQTADEATRASRFMERQLDVAKKLDGVATTLNEAL